MTRIGSRTLALAVLGIVLAACSSVDLGPTGTSAPPRGPGEIVPRQPAPVVQGMPAPGIPAARSDPGSAADSGGPSSEAVAAPVRRPGLSRVPIGPQAPGTAGARDPADRPDAGASSDVPVADSGALEDERLAMQREAAQGDALVIVSLGATADANLADGRLALRFEPAQGGTSLTISSALDCRDDCVRRDIRFGTGQASVGSHLLVASMPQGSWRITAVLLERPRLATEVLSLDPAEPFEIRQGSSTYLGAFVVLGPAEERRVASGATGSRLPVMRYSDVERDLSRALVLFPETRGRRLLNDVAGLSRPVLLR